MRPLLRPPLDPEWVAAGAAEAALIGLGDYCAICERRLPQGAVAWDAGRARPFAGPVTRETWPDLLALCPQCAAAAAEPPAPTAAGTLRPDRDATFRLGGGSPIAYRRVPLRLAGGGAAGGGDAAGDAAGAGEGGGPAVVERVVAVAESERAAAAIAGFALNTLPHADGLLLLSDADDLATLDFDDPRLELRTRAWEAAEGAVARLRDVPDEWREALEEQTRMLIEAFGFWSVWATVVWERSGDRALWERLLLGPSYAYRTTRTEGLIAGEPPAGGES